MPNRRIILAVTLVLLGLLGGAVALQRRLATARQIESLAQRRAVVLERIRTNRLLVEAAYARCQVRAAEAAERDAGALPPCAKAELPPRFFEAMEAGGLANRERAEAALDEANRMLDVADAEARARMQ